MSCVDKTKEENLAFQKFFQNTGNYIPPEDAESVEQLYERTGEFLKSLEESKKLKDKNLLISTHGAAMTAMAEQDERQSFSRTFLEKKYRQIVLLRLRNLKAVDSKLSRKELSFIKKK